MLNFFKKSPEPKPSDYTDIEWNRYLHMKEASKDALFRSLFNIIDDKDKFKEDLTWRCNQLNSGESFKVCIKGKIRKLEKDENGKISIINL